MYDTIEDASYIRQLTSYSIGRLEKEPRHLTDEQTRVQRDMETLAVDHYRSFVESSRAVHAIHTHVTTMDSKVDTLVTQLPMFTDAVATFVSRSDDIRKEQKLNRLMSEVLISCQIVHHSDDRMHFIELVATLGNIRTTPTDGLVCS